MAIQFPETANFNVGQRYAGLTEGQQDEAWSDQFPYVQLNPDGTITAYNIESGSAAGGGSGYGARYAKSPDGKWTLVADSVEPVQWQKDAPLAQGLLKGGAMLAALYGAGTGLQGLFGMNAAGGAGAAGSAGSGLLSGPGDALANIGWGGDVAATNGLGYGGVAGGAWSTPGYTSAAGAFGQALPSITNAADVYGGAPPNYASAPGAPASGTSPTTPGTTPPVTPPGGPPTGSEGIMNWLKSNAPWLIPVVGGVVAGIDANSKNGQFTGDPVSTEFLRNHMRNAPNLSYLDPLRGKSGARGLLG